MTAELQFFVSLLGVVIVVAALLDILITALHPSTQSPLTARYHRAIWFVVKRAARLLPAQSKQWLLSWTLPVSVAGLLLLWLAALLVGFALMYAPSISNRAAVTTTIGHLQWTDSFYLSGVCLTSIGFGDIVPRSGWLRALTVGEGLCGLLVIGVTVTYVLTVFPVIPVVRVLATTLNEETDGQPSVVPMVTRYLAADSAEALTQRCRELATDLRILAEAHTSHPVLFYAHPKRAEQSFARVLICTQSLVGLLRYGVRRTDLPTLVRDPRVVGSEETFIAILRQLGSSLHLQVTTDTSASAVKAVEHQFASLITELREANLRSDDAPSRAERRAYVHFRLVTNPYIAAYCANTGYTDEDLWGPHPPLRGTTAPLYEDDDMEQENT